MNLLAIVSTAPQNYIRIWQIVNKVFTLAELTNRDNLRWALMVSRISITRLCKTRIVSTTRRAISILLADNTWNLHLWPLYICIFTKNEDQIIIISTRQSKQALANGALMLHPNLTIKMGVSTTCFIWHPHKHNQQMKLGDSTICCMVSLQLKHVEKGNQYN